MIIIDLTKEEGILINFTGKVIGYDGSTTTPKRRLIPKKRPTRKRRLIPKKRPTRKKRLTPKRRPTPLYRNSAVLYKVK